MRLYLILICVLLGACSSLPPAVKDAQVIDVSYDQVSADSDSYKTTLVRWGGVIVDVENDEDFSLLQVLFYPLDYYGRPQLNSPNEGRFVIKSPEFLDPMVYATNREVIAVGTIDGDIERMADSKRIWVPLITTTPTAIYLWPINYRNNYYGNCRSCYFRQLFW